MRRFRLHYIISFAVLGLLIKLNGFNPLSAQTTVLDKKWHYLTDIYLLFPNINGETGVDDVLTVPIDATPGDIFSKLKIGGMLYVEANTDKWAITSDLVFMNLNQEITPGTVFNSGSVTSKQFIWGVDGLYRLASFVEVGVGGRLNSLQLGIDARRNAFPAGTYAVEGDQSTTWYDPLLVTRIATSINDKWLLQFKGDIGGFGIGSDLTWQLQAYAGYKFTKVFQLTAGYRMLSIDYDKTIESEAFVFNVDEFGPVVRFGFNF